MRQNVLYGDDKRGIKMSSRLFQSTILQLKETTDRVLGVIDAAGTIVACSELSLIGAKRENEASQLQASQENILSLNGSTYKPMLSLGTKFDFAAFVEGDDDYAITICKMISVTLNNAKNFYDEKNDKSTFIKNIMLDNILPSDIFVRSKELHFLDEVSHVVILVRQVGKTDIAALDVMQSLFPDRNRDFIISTNESDIALVKEVKPNADAKEIFAIAKQIENTLSTEVFLKTVIGIGTVVTQLKELAVSYKEAQVAIDVGKVFDVEKSIVSYENLGIGRLIYQLPTTLCDMFLNEVFKKNSIDSLDKETLFTIQKFFENNLNVSETSRKLFVHRNTLVYRLEKIKKLTGLDLREFDHAIIFKVALMVKRYMESTDNKYLRLHD